jgi:3D (Asp-Asp-Asp) domain-containing protein/peptidoglycan hydrolase CwlO-like protein
VLFPQIILAARGGRLSTSVAGRTLVVLDNCGTLTTWPDSCKWPLCYLPALVRAPGRGLRTLCLAVLTGAVALATLPGAGSAETAGDLQRKADELRAENARLSVGSRSAVESLAGIDSRLAEARAELASFKAKAASVQDRRRAVLEELGIARDSVGASRRALAERLRELYEEGDTDTLAVVLGSGSLSAALDAVETIDLAAKQDKDLMARSRAASRRLAGLERVLAGQQRELEQLAAVRAAAAASLAAARSEKLDTIAALQAARGSNATQIADLQDRARMLASVRTPTTPEFVPGVPASGTRTMTVTATGYSLPGNTASGMPVGWGAIAVDPGVIPIGSRIGVPGYGLGVAADTGGAIQGARIDLWFPTVEQARAWGSRVVTITVHS